MKYMFKKIEPKWQAKWEESKVFEAKDNSDWQKKILLNLKNL